MNEPMLGQTSRSAVESYLRAKREKGQLTDEEIARLDAIGFKWEQRKKKTIEEKVDLYVHYRESGKRWANAFVPLMTRSGNTERKAILYMYLGQESKKDIRGTE